MSLIFLMMIAGNDYEMDLDVDTIPVTSIAIKGKTYAVLVKDQGNGCCQVVRNHCLQKDGAKVCKEEVRSLCNNGKMTCQDVKNYIKGKEKKQKENEKKPKEKEKKQKMKVKDSKKKKDAKQKAKKKELKDTEKPKEKEIDDDEDEFEEDDDEDEEDYEDEEENKEKQEEESKVYKSKTVKELDKDELIKLTRQMEKRSKKRRPNPKCKKPSAFRQAI